jgi:hypothetical protein
VLHLSSANGFSPACARSCRCHRPWAECTNGNLGDLPGHCGPQIETVTPKSYNIEVLGANAFSELKLANLWKLDVVRCGVVTVKRNAFGGLQGLLSLHLDNNEIEVLEPGAFLVCLN